MVTALIANREVIDGIAVEVQFPNFAEQERDYLKEAAKETYAQMEAVQKRLLELLHYQKNRLAYRKRTEIAIESVREIEGEGQFPQASSGL